MDIIKKAIAAFSNASSDQVRKYPAKERFIAQRQIFGALCVCLYDLKADGHFKLDDLLEELDEDVLETAREDILAPLYANQIMSTDSKEAVIKENSLMFYPDALLIYTSAQAEIAQQLVEDDMDVLDGVPQNAIEATVEEMAEVNERLQHRFIGYMGYSDTDMDYDKIVRIVEFAYDNNMIEGKSIENWFPASYANMPAAPQDNNSIAPKRS